MTDHIPHNQAGTGARWCPHCQCYVTATYHRHDSLYDYGDAE